MNFKRKFLKILQNKLSIYVLSCCAPVAFALPVNHSKTINAMNLFRQNTDFFIWELPTIWHISLTTYMRFITIKNVYLPFFAKILKFFKSFYLRVLVFRQWFSITSKSYSFISSAKVFKKARNVFRHTDLPLCDFHSALAVCIRWRFFLMASKIASLSSTVDIMGLRPRPDCVSKPVIPSLTKRFVQLFTLMWHMSVINPTSFEIRPSDFSNIVWQRILKHF